MEFSSVNTMWVLTGAVLVFFMQAGFSMLESGFVRAKNAGNIIMKNLMGFCISAIMLWVAGFGIIFGSANGFAGGFDLFTTGIYSDILPKGVPLFAFMAFQLALCGIVTAIISGAMAERAKFSAFCIFGIVISTVIYPVTTHWIWGGGWLSDMGFHDFAGSASIHMISGAAALVGAIILGPRIGKYSKQGKSRAIPGHSLTLGALGIFILWFGWFGLNIGSTFTMDSDNGLVTAGTVFLNTALAGAFSTVAAMLFTRIRYKKPDVSMSLNGCLAGLVAITAGCDVITPGGAAVIGAVAGVVVVLFIEFIDKICRVDDPVGVISVHGVCGLLGTLAVGLFSKDEGLFYKGSGELLGTQIIGVVAILIWVVVTSMITFIIIKHTVGLRVTAKEEAEGLDATEHGLVSAYADFTLTSTAGMAPDDGEIVVLGSEKMENAVPVTMQMSPASKASKITKVEIIMRQSKFEALKSAMNEMGVTGMTVTQVLGCGIQKGKPEYYRGVEVDMHLLPKIQVEMVLAKVPVMDVIETARKVLYTGHIGDGKIFVYDVENVVKVRTGETGYDALQGMDD